MLPPEQFKKFPISHRYKHASAGTKKVTHHYGVRHAHCLNSIIIDFQYENSKQYVKFVVWLEYNLKIHSVCMWIK